MIKLCILEAGFINPALKNQYPSYSKLFKEFLSVEKRNWDVSYYEIYNDKFPKHIKNFDAFLITGSSFGVYENHNWIIKTIKLIDKVIKYKKQIVGICFGHQIIVQSMNGLVEKYSKGWATGISEVKFNIEKSWLPKFDRNLHLISFHQDQVVKIPDYFDHLAETNFCKYYALSMDNNVFTIQGHPEFSNQYTLDLLEIKKENIGKKLYLESKRGLEKQTNDGHIFQNCIANFLEKNFDL